MAVIIGAGTTIGGNFINSTSHCIISVNWAYNPNVQRIYCLGSWTPDENKTIRRPTYTLSLTVYSSGTTPTYSTEPDEDCTTADQNKRTVSVDPATCEATLTAIDFSDWVITGYGYSKDDPQNASQESWSFQRWHDVPADNINAPTYIIRGISEGSVSVEVEGDAGMTFTGYTETGSQGSVSAGGVGRADDTKSGVVTLVGASSWTYGKTGTGNVTIPYTPLWI